MEKLDIKKPITYWWNENRQDIGMEHIKYEVTQARHSMMFYREFLKQLQEADPEDKEKVSYMGFMKNAMLENFFMHFANIYNANIVEPFQDRKGVVYDIVGMVEKVKNQITTLSSKRTAKYENKLMGARDDMYNAWDWLKFAIGDWEELKDFDWEVSEKKTKKKKNK